MVRNYQIKVTSPPCDPGSERWSAFASLEADIGEVLPYLNAVWPDAIYDHEARVLTRRAAGHAVAIRPHEVAVSNVLDRNDAERLVNELITEINGVWARRGEIVPQTTMRKRPTGMEIYKLLPKTNCRACGQPTCFTFALQVAAGSAELSQCPRLSARVGDAKAAFGADVGLELASHISQEGEAIRFVPRIRNRPWTKIGHILMILLFLMALSATLVIGSRADEGLVYLIYFYDPECSVCEETHRQVLEPLMAEYSSRIFVEERSVADSANFELMIKLEQEYKVMVGGIPEVFIGQDVLAGAGEITARLKERIEHYLAQGGDRSLPAKVLTLAPTAPASASSSAGCDVCEEGRKGASVTKSTPTQGAPVSQEAATAKAMIHAAYFYQPGCDECDRAEHDLEYIQGKYPQLQIRRFDVKEEAALNQYLCNQAQVPAEKHLTAPALFIGKSYLIGEQIRAPAVESLLAPYLSTGAPEPWAGWEARKEQAEAAIVERFRSLKLATIAGAGLIDGINPCAFATIIFLIAYLSAYERKGREILAAGIAFSLGVFLTYIGVGFGFLKFLASLPFLNVIGKWVYGITMVLCLALAWGSIMDYFKARAGKTQEMALRLPDRFRNLTKRLIRKGASARQFVPASFVLGLVISLVELACTGQVYLPTIIFVLGIPEWRTRASLALLLYNILFILPLVVVFLLVYFGATSEQLMAWLAKRTATIKLVTAALFILLAAWLAYSIIAF